MKKRIVVCLLALAGLSGLVPGCRAANPQDPDSDLDSAPEERVWFGSDGFTGSCAAPAASCIAFKDDKDFVDLCVAKGFQAKTCGCAVLCSGKVDYLADVETAATGAREVPVTKEGTCASDKVAFIEGAAQKRRPGGSTDRCIESHVCNGVVGSCNGADLDLSTQLRQVGRSGCEDQVVGTHCRDGFVDSLQCPESDIALLSTIWVEFRSKETTLKRCLRKVVCSDDREGCSAEHLRQAQQLKTAVDSDGCEYWLRQFCSLGGSAW